MSKLIKGGTVVGPTGPIKADVLVDGETIAALFAPGPGARTAPEIIDATGKYVIPGGIDAHTHMQLPFGGTDASDTFDTGTKAAAIGGTTTIIDFAVQRYGEVVQDGLAAWHAKAAGNCHIDYAFHHDPRRRRRRLAQGDGPAGHRRGHHQLQALHGVPGRLLLRRRPDPARDAEGPRQRLHDHDARGERPGHRRAGQAGPGARRDGPDLPRHHPPAGARGGGHQPGDLAGQRGRGLPALHRAPVRVARPSNRSPPPATAAATCSPRPARSTST